MSDEKEFLDWKKYEESIKIILEKIKGKEFDLILAIPKGGLVIGVHLANLLNLPLFTNLEELRNVEKDDGKDINVLLVDDVADTGKTLLDWLFEIRKLEKKINIYTATIYYKKHSKYQPDCYIHTTDKWIVYFWERLENGDDRNKAEIKA